MRHEDDLIGQRDVRFLQTLGLWLLAGGLVLSGLACCGHPQTISGLSDPPHPSEQATVQLESLDAVSNYDLILYLDETERYFEGVECWTRPEQSQCQPPHRSTVP
jgi:hypothetical protein